MSDLLSVGFGVMCAAVLGCVFELLRIKFRSSAATGIWASTGVASAVALIMTGLLSTLVGITISRTMNVIDDPGIAIPVAVISFIAAFIIGIGMTRMVLGSPTEQPA